MKVWKRNAVVAAIVLFVCVAVYLNWSYQSGETADAGKTLGEAALVNGQTSDPLVGGTAASPDPASSASPEAGTTGGGSYFDSARLNRQQARDSALAILQDSIANESADETMKEANGEAIQTLASYTVSEAQIENLVTAKGYTDCVAYMNDGGISVAVAAPEEGLQETDVALISDIVMTQADLDLADIRIVEVK